MTEVNIRYNPYRLKTDMTINGSPLEKDSALSLAIKEKRLQTWIGKLPEMLKDDRNSQEFSIKFHGNTLDYDDVKDSFEHACKKGVIRKYTTTFEEAVGDSEVYNKILGTYNDLMNDPYFKDAMKEADREGLQDAIKRVENNIFPIHVIATMSAGKSTIINALLGTKLMPSKNEACTAIITEILDNDGDKFSAVVYDSNNEVIEKVPNLTYEIMNELNNNVDVARVAAEGDIPFLDVNETRLKLVDTPGPNNARNEFHKETTYRDINQATENLILYVLNYTQLATNDDANLLNVIAEQIKKGGRETRDRFIFVLNRIDTVNMGEDSVVGAINAAKAYLEKRGIDDPQIFPCSAYLALGIQTLLADIDPCDRDAVEEAVEKYNNDSIDDVARLVRKINRNEDLHLEQYSTLSPSEQEKLRDALDKAKDNDDKKTQALIHSGIRSIESAIKVYVKKYAKTKKIRDFVYPLEKQLYQIKKETEAKLAALSGGKVAEEIQRRSQAVREMIDKGEEANKFKERIDGIDPVPEIKNTAEKLVDDVNIQLTKSFKYLGEKIDGRDKAMEFINRFCDDAADAVANLCVQLEVLVNQNLTETGTKLIEEYKDKLEGFDENAGSGLDFKSSDFVAGVLSRLKTTGADYSSTGKKRSQQERGVDDIHKTEIEKTTREVIKMEKVKKEVQDGVKQVQTGEERVVVGTHQEKTGTRTVRQKRRGLLGFLGFTKKVEEDVYETFEDVEYRPTYEYVPNIKEVIEEVPTIQQEITEKKHYVVYVADLQRKLVTPLKKQLDEEVKELVVVAGNWVDDLKNQFLKSFDELDRIIKSKYEELESYTKAQDSFERKKAEIEEQLMFIEDNLKELSDALDV